ncbi:hypothetical protein Ocin01_02859 [Orchesella cincta]|uniref:Uncharacterized protein n=1 Tax=Orchesella cincta TaxID=48709 RepID=A0A1D2NEZ7_ORCCI|nr:hypothetical protein Ocin01_02859 [Orchesella cincta]
MANESASISFDTKVKMVVKLFRGEISVEEIASSLNCTQEEVHKWKDDPDVYQAVSDKIFDEDF